MNFDDNRLKEYTGLLAQIQKTRRPIATTHFVYFIICLTRSLLVNVNLMSGTPLRCKLQHHMHAS